MGRHLTKGIACLLILLMLAATGRLLVANYDKFESNPQGGESEELNPAQRKTLVDWHRNSSSQNYFFKSAGGISSDIGTGISVDSLGNVYVTGYFSENATFGSTILTSNGGSDIFVAKLDVSGSWKWVIKAGGHHQMEGMGLLPTP